MLCRDSSTRSPSRARRRADRTGRAGCRLWRKDGAGHLDRAVASSTTLAPPSTAPATTLAGTRRERPAKEGRSSRGGGRPVRALLGWQRWERELCAGPFPPGPQVVPDRDQRRVIRVEAGGTLRLCLSGFDPAKPIGTELISPSGRSSKEVIPARDQHADEFDPMVLVENTSSGFPSPPPNWVTTPTSRHRTISRRRPR